MTNGILLVDKPAGMTSHDVVARARRALGTRKIGHAGTLDPMATGLLVLGVGSATRLLHYLVGLDKEYVATIRLGWATATDDAEGEPLTAGAFVDPGDREILAAMGHLTGSIEQVPSSVSAIKVKGVRAYQRVRDGEAVELAARRVQVSVFDRVARRAGVGWVDLDVRVVCSSGTYIRALARDVGVALGTGGHLTSLRRTRVGEFAVGEASGIEEMAPHVLIEAADAARRALPVVAVTDTEAVDLRHGKRIAARVPEGTRTMSTAPLPSTTPARVPEGTPARAADGVLAAVSHPNDLVAIVQQRGGELAVVTGFPGVPMPTGNTDKRSGEGAAGSSREWQQDRGATADSSPAARNSP